MIEIQNISMTFKSKGIEKGDEEGFKALDNVSLVIPDGCAYGFLGSNGAGKSTLMRMLCGIYKPQCGSIKIDGEDVYDNENAKKKIFFVSDETVQFTAFTLDDLRRFYQGFFPTFSSSSFDRLVSRLDLPRDKKLSEFSKGMKRQAIVILGLSCKTKYLVIDEAFDGLDPAMRRVVKNMIIDEMLDQEATLIVSSHNVAEMNEFCDHAMLLHKGRLILSGEIDELRCGFCKVQLARKGRAISREEIEDCGIKIMQYSLTGSMAQVVVCGGSEQTLNALKGIDTDFTECVPMTLEEIFIYETSAEEQE